MLTVNVISFSYRKGYPSDPSGNGGGFMFDCRFLHNPGRYEPYKQLTGLDLPVREFIESRSDMAVFLESVMKIAGMAVTDYLERGFDSLQIGFGCTGGRHRSVYAADAIGRYVKRRFPQARVIVTHREQDIAVELEAQAV